MQSSGQGGGVVFKNVVFLAAGQVMGTALGVILNSTLGRYLGATDFGIYYMIWTLSGFLVGIADWGLGNYLLAELSKGRHEDRSLLGSAFVVRAMTVTVAAVLSLLLALVLGYPYEVVVLAPLSLFFTMPAFLALLYGMFLRARERTEIDVLCNFLGRAAGVGVTVLAVHVIGGLEVAVMAQAFGGVLALVAYWVAVSRLKGSLGRPKKEQVVELIKGGFPIAAMSLTINLHSLLDVTMLSHLADATVVGWHGAARTVMGLVVMAAIILSTANFPQLCRAVASPQDFDAQLGMTVKLQLLLGAFAFVGLFAYADLIVKVVYGANGFGGATAILAWIAPFMIVLFFNFAIGNAAIALGKSREVSIAKAVSIAIAAGLNLLLIPYFAERVGNGGIGVMVSFGVSEVLMLATYWIVMPNALPARTMVVGLIKAYATAFSVIGLDHLFLANAPVWMSAPLILAGFVLAALATRLLERRDIEDGYRQLVVLINGLRSSKRGV